KHIQECRRCKHNVDFFGRVDQTLADSKQPPSGLNQRIVERCTQMSTTPLPFDWRVNVLRIAAVLVVIAAITAAFLVLSWPRTSSENMVAGTDPLTISEDGIQSTGRDDVSPTRRTIYFQQSPSTFPVAKIRAGSAEPNVEGFVRSLLLTEQSKTNILPAAVRHVWVVDDLDTARKQLLDSLPAGAVAVPTNGRNHAMCFRISLSDTDLQGLVTSLERSGWALVTPALPQPGEIDSLLLTGQEVLYTADIVAR
ncbi:MAG: hypothetical protein K9N51_12570, partial [Candidatus Pacebacteria bacterium]|nr:hypothetical protein [Candidatus Paceibacterota bacterium]